MSRGVPPVAAFPDNRTVLVVADNLVAELGEGFLPRPSRDDQGRSQFTAYSPAPAGLVLAQELSVNWLDWMDEQNDQGLTVALVFPCSYPGCGKPTACLRHPDGLGQGWRHLDPADEVDSHVGYPMQHATPGQAAT